MVEAMRVAQVADDYASILMGGDSREEFLHRTGSEIVEKVFSLEPPEF